MDLCQCHLHRVMVTDGQGLWEKGNEPRDPRHLVVYGRVPEVVFSSQQKKGRVSRTDTYHLVAQSICSLEIKGSSRARNHRTLEQRPCNHNPTAEDIRGSPLEPRL